MSRTTPPYEIHSVREIPFAAARRTEVAVIVPVGTTVEDTAAIGREIAKDRRGVADYNVLQVAFYDRVELIGPTVDRRRSGSGSMPRTATGADH